MPSPKKQIRKPSKQSLAAQRRAKQIRLWKLQQKWAEEQLARDGLDIGQIAKQTGSNVQEVWDNIGNWKRKQELNRKLGNQKKANKKPADVETSQPIPDPRKTEFFRLCRRQKLAENLWEHVWSVFFEKRVSAGNIPMETHVKIAIIAFREAERKSNKPISKMHIEFNAANPRNKVSVDFFVRTIKSLRVFSLEERQVRAAYSRRYAALQKNQYIGPVYKPTKKIISFIRSGKIPLRKQFFKFSKLDDARTRILWDFFQQKQKSSRLNRSSMKPRHPLIELLAAHKLLIEKEKSSNQISNDIREFGFVIGGKDVGILKKKLNL